VREPAPVLDRTSAADNYDMLDELRRLAERTPVGTAEGIALNERILELAPDDVAAANRLGRGLQEAGRGHDALAVFETTLQRHPGNVIAARRAAALGELSTRAGASAPVVSNRDAHGPGSRVLRRARKQKPRPSPVTTSARTSPRWGISESRSRRSA
jgi:hypothetical protein